MNYYQYIDEYINYYRQNNYKDYTLAQDETLYSVADKFGITLDELMSINRINPTTPIYPGMVIKVPNNSQLTNTKGLYDSNAMNQTGNLIYTVKPGDDLFQIAHKFGTTVENIKQMNDLPSDTILTNEELVIPKDVIFTGSNQLGYPDYVLNNPNIDAKEQKIETIYTVKKGDTLYSLSKRYGITLGNLKQTNNLTSSFIRTGQQLVIPKRLNNSHTRAIDI